MRKYNKKIILSLLVVVLVLTLPVIIFSIKTSQDNRSRATAATTLSFYPTSTYSTPIQVTAGNTVSIDLMVSPGTNLVSLIKYDIQYDPNQLTPDPATPISINTTAFNTNLEGPVLNPGRISGSISIGSDPTKAITTLTRVATLKFKAATNSFGGSTQITFSSLTQVLSVGASDQASENVLSSTLPAVIAISAVPTPTGVTPTNTPSPTPTMTPTPTLTPTPTGGITGTVLNFNVKLHGIGTGGDSTNPNDTSLNNKQPVHQQQTLTVLVYNASNVQVANKLGLLTYNSASGTYTGTIDLGSGIPSGAYNVKIKADKYLRRLIPGFQNLVTLSTNTMPQTALVAGDTNGDNQLNILDYNQLLDCYSDIQPAKSCDAFKFNATDLDDNGAVNQYDYNLFLREIMVQSGD